MSDWNPELYLQFSKERGKPIIDLINSLEEFNPQKIADIGCGPGNSTQKLIDNWPESDVVGFDSSPKMIEKAKNDVKDASFEIRKIVSGEPFGSFDLVFSNAAIQWIPDHEGLFESFYRSLNIKGRVAIQLPMFYDMPLGIIIKNVAESPRWNSKLREVVNSKYMHKYTRYYNILSNTGFKNINMWQTTYYHVFPSHDTIYEMISGTGLRPYLDKLNKEELEDFIKLVKEEIESNYMEQDNGNVILPFIRLFLTGERVE